MAYTWVFPDLEPFEFIRFAEEVGLIAEFDFAMCRRVFDELIAATAANRVNWPISEGRVVSLFPLRSRDVKADNRPISGESSVR